VTFLLLTFVDSACIYTPKRPEDVIAMKKLALPLLLYLTLLPLASLGQSSPTVIAQRGDRVEGDDRVIAGFGMFLTLTDEGTVFFEATLADEPNRRGFGGKKALIKYDGSGLEKVLEIDPNTGQILPSGQIAVLSGRPMGFGGAGNQELRLEPIGGAGAGTVIARVSTEVGGVRLLEIKQVAAGKNGGVAFVGKFSEGGTGLFQKGVS